MSRHGVRDPKTGRFVKRQESTAALDINKQADVRYMIGAAVIFGLIVGVFVTALYVNFG